MSDYVKWDRRFSDLAAHVSTWSKDPSTKVGAVIVDMERKVLGIGYNGFPRGVNDLEHRYSEKATKYKMVVHAEANAILNAVANLRGSQLYCTKYPCSECAKLIIQQGIFRVVSPAPDVEGVWGEDAGFSKLMLLEAGVILVHT